MSRETEPKSNEGCELHSAATISTRCTRLGGLALLYPSIAMLA